MAAKQTDTHSSLSEAKTVSFLTLPHVPILLSVYFHHKCIWPVLQLMWSCARFKNEQEGKEEKQQEEEELQQQ